MTLWPKMNPDFLQCHLKASNREKLKIQISGSSILFVPAHITWHLGIVIFTFVSILTFDFWQIFAPITTPHI